MLQLYVLLLLVSGHLHSTAAARLCELNCNANK